MVPSEVTVVYWDWVVAFWHASASEILKEQGLEERGARTLPMLSADNTVCWESPPVIQLEDASDILNQQGLEEAPKNASSVV